MIKTAINRPNPGTKVIRHRCLQETNNAPHQEAGYTISEYVRCGLV